MWERALTPSNGSYSVLPGSERISSPDSSVVTVPFDIVRATPGLHEGTLELSSAEPSLRGSPLKPLVVRIVMPQPTVVETLLAPEKRVKLMMVAGSLLAVLAALLWLIRRNRSPVDRMVRFTPPAEPGHRAPLVEDSGQFVLEEDWR